MSILSCGFLYSTAPHRCFQILHTLTMRSVAAENRQEPQGPCGVAFLGDSALGAYTLLLYKSQDNHIARVPFTDQFRLDSTVSCPRAAGQIKPIGACHEHKHLQARSSKRLPYCLCATDQRPIRDDIQQHSNGHYRHMDTSVPN